MISAPDHEQPTLSEWEGVRYLHFGTPWVQGAMRIARPSELVLAYTRQMMAWLLFARAGSADTVGILGLGAGSLLRFVLRHSRASVETVEWNPAVSDVCRHYFRLPGNTRSAIHHLDAADWVAMPENSGRLAVLMVDLYDASAAGPVRSSLEFYQHCRRTLDDNGIMTVNLFGNHESFAPNLKNIAEAFDGRMIALPEIDEGNRVVLAFRDAVPDMTVAQLLQRADTLSQRYGLAEAPRWAREVLAALGRQG